MDTVAPISYFDREFKMTAVKILPGQYYAAQGDMGITTVLGSCVSTCLWDPVRRVGGMNHFMLPGDDAAANSPASLSARFGLFAMEVLINEMIKLGAERKRLIAKVFGGGNVLQGFGALNVGGKNGAFVLEFLKEEGIPLRGQDLFDTCARKVHFFPNTGKVMLKKMYRLDNDTVQRREVEYLHKLDKHHDAGEVEIFARPR